MSKITLSNIGQKLSDPFYKNAFFLTLIRVLNMATGFFFWFLAARYYSIEDIGLATSLLSSLGLVILFSGFGFDYSLIRFLHLSDKNKVVNTCLTVTACSSFLIGIAYIIISIIFSHDISFIQQPIYFTIIIIYLIVESMTLITGRAFTALRHADCYLLQSVFSIPKLIFLIIFSFLGSFGIVISSCLAGMITILFAFILLSKFIEINFRMDKGFISKSFRFSSGNYVSNILLSSPSLILPMMILQLCGEAETAKYFIAFTIGNLVLILPDSLCSSLFVEGSHGNDLRENAIKAGITIYIFLIPAVISIYILANSLLSLFGTAYVDAIELLRLLSISSSLVVFSSLFISIQNIRMDVESIVKLNLIRFIILMISSYIFISKFGIIGAGYAWTITYFLLSLRILQITKKEKWILGNLPNLCNSNIFR